MPKLLLPFSILPLLLFHVISRSLDAERSILLDLKLHWGIQSWNSSSSPCVWQGITCADETDPVTGFSQFQATVTEIWLYNMNITRKIPAKICDLKNLTVLGLPGNSIHGEFPDIHNCSKLQYLDLSQNYFMGSIPPDIDRLRSLESLDLSFNNFSGELPKSLGNCTRLKDIQLSSNGFWGEIPWSLLTSSNLNWLRVSDNFFSGNLPTKLGQNLQIMDISDNRFSGPIPAGISAVNLLELTASNNLFSGEIPAALMSLPNISTLLLDRNQFSGHLPSEIINSNPYMSYTLNFSRNKPSGPIPMLTLPLDYIYLDFSENQFFGHIAPQIGHLRPIFLNLSSNQLSGEVPPYLQSLRFKYSFLNNSNLCADNPLLNLPTCPNPKLSTKYLALILVFTLSGFLVIVFFASCKIRKCQGGKHIHSIETWELIAFQRLDFTESDVLSCLAENNVIGSGGSGQVYRIAINHSDSGEFVAVKRIWNKRTPDGRLEKQFIAEVQILRAIRHSNIVKLLCCISSESSKLLVYEYLKNESLDRWLHGKNGTSSFSSSMSSSTDNTMLDWPTKLHIAIGAARGLCYMHHDCSPPIIHRDVKSSNILLDAEFNAKMADFGLAKMLNREGDPETMSAIAGSFGYIAPEYAQTRKANEKIDVYSFGVVLLELSTGREATRGNEHMSLAEWAWQHFGEGKAIEEALEEEIMEECYLKEMTTLFKLGLMCTSKVPSTRPSMREVLLILNGCYPGDGYSTV